MQNLQIFFESKIREFYRRGASMLSEMRVNFIDSENDSLDY